MIGKSKSGDKNGKKSDGKPVSKVDTLVGRNTQILGDVRFSGGLHVDGVVKGKVIADEDDSAMLSISEEGRVEGGVRVPHLVLNGMIEGDVYVTQRIVLSPKARVNGNVYYKVLEMSGGATVNGQLVHESAGEQLALPSRLSGDEDVPDEDMVNV